MNSEKEIFIKNRKYYFFDDLFNTKNLDLNKIKNDEKSYENISYEIINRLNLLRLIINKMNGYNNERKLLIKWMGTVMKGKAH